MERRDEERERMAESQLPLAPIVSTPLDRRGNNNNNNHNTTNAAVTVSTRRGISIFSPTQTLDPQPQVQVHPDPDPSTRTSTTPKYPHQEIITTTPPVITRHRECQKNHAATMGGHVVDGCGEFMPSGDVGTPESLRCAACDCHRNFHRKEIENSEYNSRRNLPPNNNHHQQQQQQQNNNNNYYNREYGRGVVGPTMVNFGGGGESSSEEMNLAQPCSYSGSKKRFRTKFSKEQKDKMQELAEKLGWRMQKQNEGEVQQLCNELGVKRQVFKVWMHNNKQAMKKIQT